jgi:subtilisin family serine protease
VIEQVNSVSGVPPAVDGQFRAETTGRYVVVFGEGEQDPAAALRRVAGISSVSESRDFDGPDVDAAGLQEADAAIFSELRVAVVALDPDQLSATSGVLAVTPELVYHVLPEVSAGYLSGYRDGIGDLTERLQSGPAADGRGAALGATPAGFADTPQATWGLQATGVVSSPRSGRGIKVAVLDTGFDSTHPDFVGRQVTATSFVAGQTARDGHGHGTHCIGTSCGPKTPPTGRRYGVAHEAEIFVGKVLSDQGSGNDTGILAGIAWAIRNGCHVVSMSLGADVNQPSPAYVQVGRQALQQGTLIVAAAGNNADRRQNNPGFVGIPANSPDILAVGALQQDLAVTFFSARSSSTVLRGGQVDLAAPGWQVYSSWPMPTRYNTISGTSMATPHVAGIAALWAEQTGLRGRDLWCVLTQESRRLIEPSVDVGSGLPIAPQ